MKEIGAAQEHFVREHHKALTTDELLAVVPSLRWALAAEWEYSLRLRTTPSGYELRASPRVFGETGSRNFYMDQTGVIRQCWADRLAGPEDPPFR